MLSIVLVEPEIPQNTGNVARTCAVTSSDLILIHPLGFKTDDRSLKRAGLDYWKDVSIREYPSFSAFIEERKESDELVFFTSHGERNFYSFKADEKRDTYFIFGRESCGLGCDIISRYRDSCWKIPMRKGARCLNLSNSAAVAVYEYYRQLGFPFSE